jgi:hypothetical protein
MGRIPQSTLKFCFILYAPQQHFVLIDPFRSFQQNKPTFPLNRQVLIHQQTSRNFFHIILLFSLSSTILRRLPAK